MEINFGTGLDACIDEIYAQLKKTVLSVRESVGETQSLYMQSEKLREHFRTRREAAVNMVNVCREKLISVNNILEFESERKEHWAGVKLRAEKFLSQAEKYLFMSDKICSFLDKECEKFHILSSSAARNAEEFVFLAEAGAKGLLRIKDTVVSYGLLPSVGE